VPLRKYPFTVWKWLNGLAIIGYFLYPVFGRAYPDTTGVVILNNIDKMLMILNAQFYLLHLTVTLIMAIMTVLQIVVTNFHIQLTQKETS